MWETRCQADSTTVLWAEQLLSDVFSQKAILHSLEFYVAQPAVFEACQLNLNQFYVKVRESCLPFDPTSSFLLLVATGCCSCCCRFFFFPKWVNSAQICFCNCHPKKTKMKFKIPTKNLCWLRCLFWSMSSFTEKLHQFTTNFATSS